MARPNNAVAIARHVQGLREAKARFQALPEVVRNEMNKATEVTLSEVRRLARLNLVASPSIRTRALYNAVNFKLNRNSGVGVVGIESVTTTMQVGGKKIRVKGIVIAGAGGSALISKGARLIKPSRYAHFVEFGTVKARPEPFMRPAVAAQRSPFESRMRSAAKGVERKMSATSGLL